MKNKEALALWPRALRLIYKLRPSLLLSKALSAATEAWTPYVLIFFSARIIDELAGARNPQALQKLVWITLLAGLVLALLSAAAKRWATAQSSTQYCDLLSIYNAKLLALDFCVLDDHHTLDLFSQVKQNDQRNGKGLRESVRIFDAMISSILKIAGALALTVTLPVTSDALLPLNHPLAVLCLFALMLAITFLAPHLTNKAGAYWVSYADKAKLGNRMFGYYGFRANYREPALDIRMYRQHELFAHYQDHSREFTPDSWIGQKARGAIGLLHAGAAAISNIFTGIAYVFVCLKAYGGAFGIGMVTQYVGAITALAGGVSKFMEQFGAIRNNATFLKDTFEFLDIPNPMYQGSLSIEKRADRNYEVKFRHVSFRYPGSEAYALKDVSMKFRVGSRLAIVGENGSGKTTFIKLLCRLYDPTEGEILLNDIDIRKYNYAEYLSIFSVVFQDFKLLSASLGSNVAASEKYDQALVDKCLKDAGYPDHMSLETNLYKNFDDKGVDISGGEAQKIALTRALHKDAPFIVLDEPTAALDPIAESEVYARFDEIVTDKTAIYISHRLSSCRFCDEIAVFDEGEIVQTGSHDQLVGEEGKYSQLWFAQAQYYQKSE